MTPGGVIVEPRLDRIAGKIAKDPKAVARARKSFAAVRAGSSVEAFRALDDVQSAKIKAKKRNAK